MNLKNYFYLLLTIFSVAVFASCDDDPDLNKYSYNIETEKLLVNGEEVNSFYFYAPKTDTLYVVNSDSELFSFRNPDIDYTDIGVSSNVDYAKNSVLFIGGESSGIAKIEHNYWLDFTGGYVLRISITLSGTKELVRWSLPVVVPKVDSTMKVSAEVQYFNLLD